MAKKRRRLKKPIRRALKKAKQLGMVTLAFTTAVVVMGNGPTSTVKASYSPKELARVTAKLQQKDLLDSQTLKTVILDTYADKTGASFDTDSTTVVMRYPAVVSEPSLDNAVFEIIPSEQPEITNSTEEASVSSENAEADSAVGTENSSEDTAVVSEETASPSSEPAPTELKDSTEEVDSNEEVIASASPTAVSEPEATEEDDGVKEDAANELILFSESETVDFSEGNSLPSEEVSPTASPEATSAANEVNLDEITSLQEISSNGSKTGMNDVLTTVEESQGTTEEKVDTTKENKMLKLISSSVTIQRNTDFVASNYILSIGNEEMPFPVLKVEGYVDTATIGTYELTYSVVDTKGSKESAKLSVEVVKSDADIAEEERIKEEAEKARLAAIEAAKVQTQVEKNLADAQAFANRTVGISWDLDGNDAWCFDIWAKYVRDNGLNFDFSCSPGSYVHMVYKKYWTSGASKYFDLIDASNVQPGDWLFWDEGSSCPLSHVALLLQNNGDGTGVVLSQSHNSATEIITLKLDVLGGFRRK